MDLHHLKQNADALVKKGKGLLAADESTATAGRRLALIGKENTEENRQKMREMFFSTPEIGKYISGVILYDETLRQNASTGETFVNLLAEHDVLSGIKVDLGLADFGDNGEKTTKGLAQLAMELPEYYDLGARFAKWRAVFSVSDVLPTDTCIDENCELLARYAKICQQHTIVPIVEPEVLIDDSGNNNTHTLARCEEVIRQVHGVLFEKLKEHDVYFEGMLLKPSMVINGSKSADVASEEEVARTTFSVLKDTVPAEVAGIAFLSGGQSDEQATNHLNLMNKIANDEGAPRALTYSYGRALQTSALLAWGGKDSGLEAGQKEFLKRAHANSLASQGLYDGEKA